MLVLSRCRQESVIIGDRAVTIEVLDVRGRIVRLGITAPNFGVLRGEKAVGDERPQPRIGGGGFLVLSRKKEEWILIGDNFKIVVSDIRGDKVRLGIEAPDEVPVHRNEVFEAIQREMALLRANDELLPVEKNP